MRALLWSVVGACLLITSTPWYLSMPSAGIDPSWQMALHYAYAQGMQFGSDIVFTFGPLGFLYVPQYYPGHYYAMLACWVCLSLLFLVVIYSMSIYSNKVQLSIQLILLYTILTVCIYIKMDVVLFSFFALLLLFVLDGETEKRRWKTTIIAGLIFFSALIGLIKYSGLMLAIVILLLLDVRLLMLRKLPFYIISFAVLLVLISVSLGKQDWAGILLYVQNGWLVASGFSQAMQISKSVAELGVYLLSVAVFIVFSVLIEWKEKRFDLTVFTRWLGLLLVLFMSFKAGHVRQDGHIEISWGTFVFVLALYSVYFFKHFPQRAYQLMFYAIAVLAVLPTIYIHTSRAHLTYFEVLQRDVVQRMDAAQNLLLHGKHAQDVAYKAAIANIKKETPLQSVIRLGESVDIYPWQASVLIANELNYTPRPLLQSYQAYTGKLAALDRDFLYSDRAPAWIVFGIASIDGRYPGMDDGYSWPDILSLYDVDVKVDKYVILKRRLRPRTLSYERLPSKPFGLGENILLPLVNGHDGYLSVSLDLRLTVFGEIMKALYKTPKMYMTITRSDGSQLKYRLIPEVLAKGVIISPIVNHLPAWMQMVTEHEKKPMNADYVPKSVTFSGGKGFCSFYDCQTALALKRLTFASLDK